ncbi:hypothetical protein ARGLB_027_00840 [Arthrobacter globiformis NBRC 12137]|uniref:Uncharacterized protein n=1 Tax=Arthrobacter globiformis (strain ATCC 8010 / DSM 20124 / JCM 1332 / NBRC 12137 / NCIMB 8907 / NRRL B-2979 / 168) TaxID=1077972 RepID=H0QIV4_ARTG1|nr:hypothetical protein [Arthrobacter globiformis]GAB12755.1 hypothetical protein ARGLB_027_00840 [Arthrobacter globiformis NBRC 12137]
MTDNQRPQGAGAPPPNAQDPNPLASGQLAESPQSDTRTADDPLGEKQPADDPLGSDPLTLDRRNPPRSPGS